VAFSLVVRLRVVCALPAGRVPVGSPLERTGAVTSTAVSVSVYVWDVLVATV
jgi:hypothetical protein